VRANRDTDGVFDQAGADSRVGGLEVSEFIQPVYVLDAMPYALRNQTCIRGVMAGTVTLLAGEFSQFYFWCPRGVWIRRLWLLSASGHRLRLVQSGATADYANSQTPETVTLFLPSSIGANKIFPGALVYQYDPRQLTAALGAGSGNPELFGMFRTGTTGAIQPNGIDVPGSTTRDATLSDIWLPASQTLEVSVSAVATALIFQLELAWPAEYLSAPRL
jgi:hypothetical protein